jgi:hypothetical protein
MSSRTLLNAIVFSVGLALSVTLGGGAQAQELTPRAYWPAPKGMHILILGYVYSVGDVVTDPTLPVIGTETKNHFAQFGYQHTFGLAGRSASLLVSVPYVWGTTKAAASDQITTLLGTRNLSALGDARIRLAVNLIGAPTMDVAAFQEFRQKRRPVLGASLQLSVPIGDYEVDKLINAGTNRWAIKTDLGYIHPIRSTFLAEFDLGVWFFTDNDEFLGQTREQDPLISGEFHLVKRIRPGFWASFDLNFYGGGRTTVGGVLRADLQRNSRVGATVAIPFLKRHAVKVTYSTGVVARSGGDYSSLQLNYLLVFR